MASTVKGSKTYGFSDAWIKNERQAARLAEQEGKKHGWEKAPIKKLRDPRFNKDVELRDNGAVGLDGQDFHYGGEPVTFLTFDRKESGDHTAYFKVAGESGTYQMDIKHVGQGRTYLDPKSIRKTFSH